MPRYFQYVNPQWPILDPSLHTLTYVQTHSALLMSAILAVGSTALASLPDSAAEQDSEALALHTHVEKVNLVVYMTGAQSIEIIQAHIVRRLSMAFADVRFYLDTELPIGPSKANRNA